MTQSLRELIAELDELSADERADRLGWPGEVQLEDEFGVARDTLRKAVQVFKAEGLVETVTGMGVYVVQR
ncbi:GntR family transcriptional regulator [Nonomuraea sp. B1E8]|uniref:GntR family transcriptional regulator n=1 Tax=unclassified Nonomuraea TaxID=2593643 RepID=UPI00325D67A9